jgi:hypothetical protein
MNRATTIPAATTVTDQSVLSPRPTNDQKIKFEILCASIIVPFLSRQPQPLAEPFSFPPHKKTLPANEPLATVDDSIKTKGRGVALHHSSRQESCPCLLIGVRLCFRHSPKNVLAFLVFWGPAPHLSTPARRGLLTSTRQRTLPCATVALAFYDGQKLVDAPGVEPGCFLANGEIGLHAFCLHQCQPSNRRKLDRRTGTTNTKCAASRIRPAVGSRQRSGFRAHIEQLHTCINHVHYGVFSIYVLPRSLDRPTRHPVHAISQLRRKSKPVRAQKLQRTNKLVELNVPQSLDSSTATLRVPSITPGSGAAPVTGEGAG